MGEDGVVRSRREGAFGAVAHENHLAVPVARAAFGAHQVIASVLLIHVRPFNPNGFLADVCAAVDDDLVRAGHHLVFLQVVVPYLDDAVSLILFFSFGRRVVVHHVSLAVVVKEQRGVYAVEFQLHRVAPSLHRVFGLHHHIAESTGELCRNHVEGVVVRVVADGRGIHTHADAAVLHLQLRLAVEHVPDLLPVHQVCGMEDGYAGEHGKRGVHQVVVLALPRDAGVGIAALQDGAVELVGLQGVVFVDLVIALVGELSEYRCVDAFPCFGSGREACGEQGAGKEHGAPAACLPFVFQGCFFHFIELLSWVIFWGMPCRVSVGHFTKIVQYGEGGRMFCNIFF